MTITFIPIIPADPGPSLPTCPDGSGDLWWDDASYARYQAWDPPEPSPEHIVSEADSPNYCDGPAIVYDSPPF